MLRALALPLVLLVAACAAGEAADRTHPNETPALRAMIDRTAAREGVPPDLVRRVVARESAYVPSARNGPYLGLMQIHPETARTMGYRGAPQGLLNPQTNLTYGTRYLRGAWLVAEGNRAEAVGWYRRGYYYEAKRKGLLEETGLR